MDCTGSSTGVGPVQEGNQSYKVGPQVPRRIMAGKCGAEACIPFGLKPGSASGHYMRKVKQQLGLHDPRGEYRLNVPYHAKMTMQRAVRPMPMNVPYEAVMPDVADSLKSVLGKTVAEGNLPPCYFLLSSKIRCRSCLG